MATVIKSGITTDVATVDPTLKALHVVNKGVSTTNFNHDDFTMDSFERLRVSEARIVFEDSFSAVLPSGKTTVWEAAAVASGTSTLTTNLFGTDLNTLAGAGTGYWIQSYNHIRYAPGISTLFRITFNFNQLITNVRSRVGMFTDQGTFPSTAGDGLYLEADGGAISFVRRYMTTGTGGAEERILQANWNMDKMDGTGKSGVNLDWTLAQHLVIEYQWLGVGTIRFGFETGSAGIVWAHQISSVNFLSTAWSRTGNLPVRAEIITTGAVTPVGKLTLINCVVLQEGDVAELRGWRNFNILSGAPRVTGLTALTNYPVLSLRAVLTNDLTKRTRIIPTSISITVAVVATGPTALQVQLLMLPTPNTGASFALTTGGSFVVGDVAATATTAQTGSAIWGVLIPNVVGTYTFDLPTLSSGNLIGQNAAGSLTITGANVLMLAAGPVQTATVGASISASINYKELV